MDAAAPRPAVIRVRRVLTWAFTAELAALLATGVYLAVWYRPSTAQSWPGLADTDVRWSLTQALRTAHRWVAWLTVLTSVLLAGSAVLEAAVRWDGPGRRRLGVAVGPAIAVLTLITALTGFLLPWDQLALKAVTVGTDMTGYRPLFDDQVRFVLVGGLEMSTASMRAWFLGHALVLPVLIVALLVLLARDRRAPD